MLHAACMYTNPPCWHQRRPGQRRWQRIRCGVGALATRRQKRKAIHHDAQQTNNVRPPHLTMKSNMKMLTVTASMYQNVLDACSFTAAS